MIGRVGRAVVVSMLGLAWAAGVGGLAVGVSRWFDIYDVWIGGFLPAGAVLMGAVSAYGFARTSRIMRSKPEGTLALNACVMAFVSLGLFRAARFESTSGLQEYLLSSTLLPVHSPGDPIAYRFVFGVLFVSALVGGALIPFRELRKLSYCRKCRRYRQHIATKVQYFADRGDYDHYLSGLAASRPGGPAYGEEVARHFLRVTDGSAPVGTYRMRYVLVRCPQCASERIDETGGRKHERIWETTHQHRETVVAGLSMREPFLRVLHD